MNNESNGNGGGTALMARADDTPRAPALTTEHFEVAQRMAKALAASSVVPKDYQDNIANVMVAMEYANRLGASVLAVMQNLDLIHGRPSLRATFLIGTVNACERFSPIRFRWQGEEGADSWGCRAWAKDRESGEECVGPLITIKTAKDEGWFNKSGSKWKTIPELMLMYRAAAWWSRVYAPELSLGLHTSDEVEDYGGRPGPSTGAQELNEALRAPKTIEGEPVEEVSEPRSGPATKEDIAELLRFRDQAREADIGLESSEEEAISEGIRKKDGPVVRAWIDDLTKRVAEATGSLAV